MNQPVTDSSAGHAGQLPEDGLLPDLSLYERLIGDGIAAADRRGRAVDHVTARGWPSGWPPARSHPPSPGAWSASSAPGRSPRR